MHSAPLCLCVSVSVSISVSVPVSLSLSFCLSLSHTHTHYMYGIDATWPIFSTLKTEMKMRYTVTLKRNNAMALKVSLTVSFGCLRLILALFVLYIAKGSCLCWMVKSPSYPVSTFTPWAYYQIRKIASCACAGNVFPRRRFQRKLLVSDPGMHHGTCVTHVPWCMSGSLTCGDPVSTFTPCQCLKLLHTHIYDRTYLIQSHRANKQKKQPIGLMYDYRCKCIQCE